MGPKSRNVRQVMNKVSGVGLVKKYFGKDNFITVRPECHIIKPTNQEQVFITHKKNPKQNHQQLQSLNKTRKRIMSILREAISAYKYQL